MKKNLNYEVFAGLYASESTEAYGMLTGSSVPQRQNQPHCKENNIPGLAAIIGIVLRYYFNLEKFFNQPDADLKIMLAEGL